MFSNQEIANQSLATFQNTTQGHHLEIYEDRIQEEETINGDELPHKSSSASDK